MSTSVLAHAVAESIGAVPLSLVLVVLLALFLGVGAVGTRRAATRTGVRSLTGVRHVRAGSPATPVSAEPSVRPDDEGTAGPSATAGRIVGPVLLLLVALLAAFGPTDPANNLTDVAVLVLLWGAVAIASMAFGAFWHRVDPIAGIHAGLSRLSGDPDGSLVRPLPAAAVDVAAVVGLMVWAWAQMLVDFSVLGFLIALLLYVLIHVVVAGMYGRPWLRAAESLTVLSDTLGLLGPTEGGPLRRLGALPDSRRLRWVVATLIAWSMVDLLFETDWWHDSAVAGGSAALLGPVVLIAGVLLVGALVTAVARPAGLGPALVPVAGGWAISHYLSTLLIEGQGVRIWLSDPFGSGADLLGARDQLINLEPLPIGVLVLLQMVPFVVGHLAGVVVAQRRVGARAATPGAVSAATLEVRAVIAVSLLGGAYLQLGGL